MYDNLEQSLQIMETVEKELNRQKAEAVFNLSLFLGAMSVWVLLVALWDKLGRPLAGTTMTYGVELIAILMFAVTQWKKRVPLKELGINTRNLVPTLLRAAAISAGIIAVMCVVKLVLKPGEALLDWSKFGITYPLTSVLQEFLARGFLLNCMLNIFDFKQKKVFSVILSSLLFTTLHLYYGFTFMVGAGVLSVLLGFLYLKDENIWGVSIVHFVFGMTGTMLSLV